MNQPKPGLRVCLACYAESLASLFICALIFPLAPLTRRSATSAPGVKPPLILIHGLYNHSAVWIYMGRRFHQEGFACSTFSYHSFFTSTQDILQRLEKHVRAVETSFPGQKPIFVCHSLGGLLFRHWLLQGENHTRPGGALTMGTPHQGSKTAALAPGALAKNLLPASGFLRSLQNAPKTNPPCVSLVSSTDEAVLPASSLLPPKGWRLRFAPGGHFSMLFRPSVADLVISELRKMAATGCH
ncbi:MAG: alpha/beta fold hydrolase [Desulfovibrionaceae bacterium]|nr:alpha/beta fold hydrolase [Desulfovibrionaceae bacterium]